MEPVPVPWVDQQFLFKAACEQPIQCDVTGILLTGEVASQADDYDSLYSKCIIHQLATASKTIYHLTKQNAAYTMIQNKHVQSSYSEVPDNKDPQIDIDQTLNQHKSVGSMSNQCQSKGLCYLLFY